jgi:hypothetical protein
VIAMTRHRCHPVLSMEDPRGGDAVPHHAHAKPEVITVHPI